MMMTTMMILPRSRLSLLGNHPEGKTYFILLLIMTTMMTLPRSGISLLSSRAEGKTYLISFSKLKSQTNYFNDDGDDDAKMMILPRSRQSLLGSCTEGKTYLILLLKQKSQTKNYSNNDDDDNNDDIGDGDVCYAVFGGGTGSVVTSKTSCWALLNEKSDITRHDSLLWNATIDLKILLHICDQDCPIVMMMMVVGK